MKNSAAKTRKFGFLKQKQTKKNMLNVVFLEFLSNLGFKPFTFVCVVELVPFSSVLTDEVLW